jgi:hypothetical protein
MAKLDWSSEVRDLLVHKNANGASNYTTFPGDVKIRIIFSSGKVIAKSIFIKVGVLNFWIHFSLAKDGLKVQATQLSKKLVVF